MNRIFDPTIFLLCYYSNNIAGPSQVFKWCFV